MVKKPIQIILPKGSMLNPYPPAAVVAGNVETSQVVTDTVLGALGVMALIALLICALRTRRARLTTAA